MKHKVWVVGPILACLWACGSPEQATVEQFFRASQSDDSATVAAMSAVAAPDNVESWELVEISSQSTEPFALPDLLAKLKTAEEERKVTTAASTRGLATSMYTASKQGIQTPRRSLILFVKSIVQFSTDPCVLDMCFAEGRNQRLQHSLKIAPSSQQHVDLFETRNL